MRFLFSLLILAFVGCSGVTHVAPVPEPQPVVEPPAAYDVKEVTLNSQPTLAKMVTGRPDQAAELIGGALAEVQAYLKKEKIKATGHPYVRTFLYSDSEWKFEAGFPVKKKLSLPPGELRSTELPMSKAARTLHVGPYDKTPAAYEALERWAVAERREKAGAPWEVYLNDPGSTKAVNLKTEVFLPVR